MSVRIRLQRHGSKKRPFYRLVAADQRSPRDGRYKENLGTYDPLKSPRIIDLNLDRIDYWLSVGAQPSETATSLIARARKGEGVTHAQFAEHNKARLAAEREAALNAKAVEVPEAPKNDAAAASEDTAEASAEDAAADAAADAAPEAEAADAADAADANADETTDENTEA
jgi:small subunit ribosomal protein S16